jgi:hypothetical protein
MNDISKYSVIDPQINLFAKKHNFLINTKSDDDDVRYFYFTNKNGDCYQISLAMPSSERVEITLAAIESKFDDDLKITYNVKIDMLNVFLEKIILFSEAL